MRSHTIQILGKDWEFNIMNFKEFANRHGSDWDALAMTDADKREIDAISTDLTRTTIIHELVHAYKHEMCVNSVDFDDDNLEEFFAELFAHRGDEILELSVNLYKKVKKEKRK